MDVTYAINNMAIAVLFDMAWTPTNAEINLSDGIKNICGT